MASWDFPSNQHGEFSQIQVSWIDRHLGDGVGMVGCFGLVGRGLTLSRLDQVD